jgi:hypothetical protein
MNLDRHRSIPLFATFSCLSRQGGQNTGLYLAQGLSKDSYPNNAESNSMEFKVFLLILPLRPVWEGFLSLEPFLWLAKYNRATIDLPPYQHHLNFR